MSQDYHINTRFKMGGDQPQLLQHTTPKLSNTSKEDPTPLTPNTNENALDTAILGTNTPTSVAKATPRMMGKTQSQPQPQPQMQTQPQMQSQAHENAQQQPLMPPVEISYNKDGTLNTPNHLNLVTEQQKNRTPTPAAQRSPQTRSQSQSQSQAQAQSQSQQRKSSRSRQNEPKQFHRKSLGDWDFLETVGAGSMGKVKLAKHHYTNEICAIKVVNRATKGFLHKEQTLPPPQTEQEILERQKNLEKEISRDKRTIREASLGQILYHPHICRLFEMCTMSNHFYMLFEYVSGGQLLDYIIQHGSLREHHARKFARGIASALQYLHSNNIVHRDLKIENIMISTSGEIKIIDFGLSNLYDTTRQLHTFCGSLYFAAPELLKAHPYTGPEVDVWSFGVVLYVLVCGKVPFDDENSSVLHEKIKQGKVDYPQHLSIEVISLLSKMLVVDPKKRATLRQVVEHHWMVRGYDNPSSSYLPNRIPLTPQMLDYDVVKEMLRLEFIDDIDETMNYLTKIISDETYLELSNQYWSLIKEKNLNINEMSPFDNPLQAYHPLISIYYLVDEMLRNKLKKLQRRQMQFQQQQNLELQRKKLELQKQNAAASAAASAGLATTTPAATPVIPQPVNSPIKTQLSPIKTDASPMVKSRKEGNLSSPAKQSQQQQKSLKVMIPPKLIIPEQAHTSPTTRKTVDRQNDIDTVFAKAENKINNYNDTPENSTYASPMESPSKHQANTNVNNTTSIPDSPDDENKTTIGNIFRRLSSRRHPSGATTDSSPTNNPTSMDPSQMQKKLPDTVIPKTHSRAYSEYVPSNRNPNYGSMNTPPVLIRSPQRSASQKQNADLPALPMNAETIVQQQRAKQLSNNMENLKINQDSANDDEATPTPTTTAPTDTSNNNNNTQDNSYDQLNIPKGRKLHPNARAKSVGHARRESLKYSRPPVPANLFQPEMEDNGFLHYSDDNRSDNNNTTATNATSTSTNNNTTKAGIVSNNINNYTNENNSVIQNTINNQINTHEIITEHLLSDDEILDQAAKAPPGTMPSIDFPRSLFLKGFFSVQTTSSKPLPIVRYKIITVLKKMNIEFKEVKGGFICLQRYYNNNNLLNVNTTAAAATTTTSNTSNTDTDAEDQVSKGLTPRSRHNSIKRQGSINKYFANNLNTDTNNAPPIPMSPMGMLNNDPNTQQNSTHGRSMSTVLSPTRYSNNNSSVGGGGVSGDVSAASLEYINQDENVLTNSRAEGMNRIDNQDAINDDEELSSNGEPISKTISSNGGNQINREKQPIKFEIHIVKVRIVGLAGVHFKKVSGNTWLYKELASRILNDLNL
ncbi:hypothetical protein TBLA_0C04600 [Henningerozyma blattae CBS 6284]|uniref:non-specific serine/threonine protein kinase n=1 Tax=Henningerozyma blattae (strain ATCC 34711 / CBS 6284 / DSM 70876 / NBRC 10599 / NRRL Y-10934 / UCD 77-7) TaxID=1071380 RepID=I2H1K4_HENB6|nr:hypothetical protein TBLA_0C04600 [Tetrapisispora blattae CBS 6284]CCH60256.1 hypothetical protein TBLA_0C04600 [Tetrapisispora blattae CBS 6284]